jgi:integrase
MNSKVKEVIGRQKRVSEYVFPSPKTGGRLVDVKTSFNKAREAAGLQGFQLRDLRHSCATRLSDAGEELVIVSEILGHTDVRMTRRYSHGLEQRKRDALEKLASPHSDGQNTASGAEKEKRQTV